MNRRVLYFLCLLLMCTFPWDIILAQEIGSFDFKTDNLRGSYSQQEDDARLELARGEIGCAHPENPVKEILLKKRTTTRLVIDEELKQKISAALSVGGNLGIAHIEAAIGVDRSTTSSFIRTSEYTSTEITKISDRPSQCFQKKYTITVQTFGTNVKVEENPWGPRGWNPVGEFSWETHSDEEFIEEWRFDSSCGDGAACELSDDHHNPVLDPQGNSVWGKINCGGKIVVVPLFWKEPYEIILPYQIEEIPECRSKFRQFLGIAETLTPP